MNESSIHITTAYRLLDKYILLLWMLLYYHDGAYLAIGIRIISWETEIDIEKYSYAFNTIDKDE